MLNTLSRIAKQLLRTKLNKLEVGRERLPFVRGKRTQQMIAVQVGLKGQHDDLLFIFLRGAPFFYSGRFRVS